MKKLNLHILYISILCTYTIKAQCYPDRHSTNWFDGWISCEVSSNPVVSYGETHWIMYDLGYEYVLNETKFWNANDPNNLNYGINDFNIDYSLDGVSWSNLGTYKIEQASGLSNYEGEDGPDFNKAKVRYVLITPTSNYGGDCFGLSELKITITDPFLDINEEEGFNASVYPNPFIDHVSIRIASLDKNAPINYSLYDILGREIANNNLIITEERDTYELPLNGNSLSIGIYVLKITQNNKERSFKLIKKE